MKKLPQQYKFLLKKEQRDDSIFPYYQDPKVLGTKILSDLLKQRITVKDGDVEIDGIPLNDRSKELGLMSDLYAGNAIFSLAARYGVILRDYQAERALKCLRAVLAHVEKHGYDLSPYLDPKVNDLLFGKKPEGEIKYEYIGAMTWALSLFSSARAAQLKGTVVLTEEEQAAIFKQMRYIISFFVKNAIKNDTEVLGWGYTNECRDPSLFFTYSVLETYSDFEDMVIAKSRAANYGDDEEEAEVAEAAEITEEDDESALGDPELYNFINGLDPTNTKPAEDCLTSKYRNLCFAIGDRVWSLFGVRLKDEFFADNIEKPRATSVDNILNAGRSSALFNNLYLIFILFYSYANTRQGDQNDEVVNTMTRGLQFIQNFYDELCAKKRESIVDKHIISFSQRHLHIADFGKELNEETIPASPLLPMLVKANNMISYHILRFPQQTMYDLFIRMLDAKTPEAWVWEGRRFDLLATERYLESIADYFMYYDAFEREYAKENENKQDIRDKIERSLNKKYEDAAKKADAEREKELAAAKEALEISLREELTAEITESVHRQYTIENEINNRIDKILTEKVEEKAMAALTGALGRIAAYNALSAEAKADAALSEQDAQLKQTIESLIPSYIALKIEELGFSANEVGATRIQQLLGEDAVKSLAAYAEFIAKFNIGDEQYKRSLGDIFKLLSERKSN